jgi:glycosyltransferase involved in cell wall biosynthesis
MILVVEPVFPNAHHAPGNSGKLRAIRLAAPDEEVVFAAHPAHRDAVFTILGESERRAYTHRDIEVIPAGGINFRRFRSQAATIFGLTKRLKPRIVVYLGTQPETLFACRLLTMIHRDTPVIAVLHGNLNQAAVGWRSRDPRRRWFDDRASLAAAAASSAIQFVVLEKSIRDAAIAMGLIPPERCHVWPLAIPDSEAWTQPHRPDPGRIRIAFIGSAKVAKGFGDFAAITRRLTARNDRYEFSLIGGLQDSFQTEDLAHIRIPSGFLDRADFLQRLYAVDYVCLPLRGDTYTLTASGVLLDSIAALKPVIALPTPAIRDLFRGGPVGYLCDDLTAMTDVMGDTDRLADPGTYEGFRANLERERDARSPSGLAHVVAPLLAPGRLTDQKT